MTHLDRLNFTKHLAVLLNSGITITEALQVIKDQSRSSLKRMVGHLQTDIDNGKSFTEAMSKYPRDFNLFYLSYIKVGETSGKLSESLNFLAEYLNKDYQTKKKIQSALLYPALVLGATLLIGGVITFYLLPQLLTFFESFEATLPLSTTILLFFARLVKQFGVLIIVALLLLVLLFIGLLNLPPIKYLVQSILLRLPLVGPVLNNYYLARFNRNLGTMLKSGIPITEALAITSKTMANSLPHRYGLEAVLKKVSSGESLSNSFAKTTSNVVFPSLVVKMIEIGEKSGQLENNLLYLADFYEEEIDTASKSLSTIIEPILLVIIGLAVAFLAVAIISPIYELTGSLGRP